MVRRVEPGIGHAQFRLEAVVGDIEVQLVPADVELRGLDLDHGQRAHPLPGGYRVLARTDFEKVGAEGIHDAFVLGALQGVQVLLVGEVADEPCLRGGEQMVFDLWPLALRLDVSEVNERPGAERPALRAQQVTRDQIGLRRRGSYVLEHVLLESGDAYSWMIHPRYVVENDPHGSQVDAFDVGPAGGEELDDEAPVTVLGGRLATQQRRKGLESRAVEHRVDPPLLHQRHEVALVGAPIALALLVCVEDVLGRRQQRLMLIRRTDEFAQEVRQVGGLRESGQLRGVVEADVDEPVDAGVA